MTENIIQFLLRQARRLVRFPVLVVLVVWNVAVLIPSHYFERDKRKRIARAIRQTRTWGRGIMRCFGIKLVLHGSTEAYHGKNGRAGHGGLVVSNHQALMDVFVHGGVFGFRFAPKGEIKKWPFIGWYVDMSSPVWINRASRMESKNTLEEFRETLRSKQPLIVYPEGTTTDGVSGMLPFKNTAFETVVDTEIPVQPVITIYKPSRHAKHIAWYGDMGLLTHIWMLLGNGRVEVHVYVMEPVYAEGRNRKELSQYIYDLMSNEYEKRLSELKR